MVRPPSDEEKEILEASVPYLSWPASRGWSCLKVFMDDMVARSESNLLLNQSAEMDTVLRMQWQQRNFMRQAVVNHVEGLLQKRREILEELEQEETEVTW